MTYFKYFTVHLIHFWVQHWTCNLKIWADLMTDNYEGYALSKEDDPYQECYEWFWETINSDETLSKEYLEELLRRMGEPSYPMPDDLWEEDN